jgi:ribonuclease PH
VALVDAVRSLQYEKLLKEDPVNSALASVSVGIYKGTAVLDLDYAEDSNAETDMNVVMNDDGHFIEVQGTAEGHAFNAEELNEMLVLAQKGINELFEHQREALSR